MPRHYVNTALGQMHVRTQGSGPPLLLLGSAGRSARMFDHLIPLLSERFQLIAPDMFGHGNSDPLPASVDIRAIAGCMAELLDAFSIQRANVYGFHSGNKIGAALAANWPDRIDKLILAGQSHSIIERSAQSCHRGAHAGILRDARRCWRHFEGVVRLGDASTPIDGLVVAGRAAVLVARQVAGACTDAHARDR